MNKPNKKTIGGIALASILIGGFIIFTPQNANADLTVLDKFGTILNILTDIQNIVIDIQTTVNNIFNEITDPGHGLEEIKREVRIIESNVTSSEHGLKEIKREVRNIEGNVTEINSDLLLKKRFYQFVNDTEIDVDEGNVLIAEVRVVSCAPELLLANACAFNVESILVNSTSDMLIVGPIVDGIASGYVAQLDSDINFLVDAFRQVTLTDGNSSAIGPIGVIGASESVGIIVVSDGTINKIEFNGEQPQGMELQLVLREEFLD